MPEDIAVSVNHVSKDFVLPHEKITTVKGLFTSIHKRRKKTKDTLHALRDVSLDIKKGEFFGIVGRNGSGKSTMLKMLAGIYQPSEGKITTRGKLVPFIELGVGFNPELTGRENIYLNGAMMGFSQKDTAAMYDDIVSFAELKPFMDQKLKNYSTGMQVRLAFSVAVKAEADILVIDEVLAVGDAAFQRKCYEYFKSLKKNQKTVVFVTHDMSAIREFCDRAVLIEDSKLIGSGNPDKIATKYSQLFMSSDSLKKTDTGTNGGVRWGSGKVTINRIAFKKPTLRDSDGSLEFTVTLKGSKQNDGLMTGFTLKSGTGETLHGTNTWIEKVELPQLARGETVKVTWKCPNIYGDGRYYLDVFVYGDGNEVYDYWDDAASFDVKRKQRQPFSIEPPLEVVVR